MACPGVPGMVAGRPMPIFMTVSQVGCAYALRGSHATCHSDPRGREEAAMERVLSRLWPWPGPPHPNPLPPAAQPRATRGRGGAATGRRGEGETPQLGACYGPVPHDRGPHPDPLPGGEGDEGCPCVALNSVAGWDQV